MPTPRDPDPQWSYPRPGRAATIAFSPLFTVRYSKAHSVPEVAVD